MNLNEVMTEVGDALDTIPGLRVSRFWPDGIYPPAAIVGLPDEVELETTYGQGFARMTIPVVVLVGKMSDRASAERIASYASGSGAESVKVAIDAYPSFTALDVATVTRCEFDVMTIESVDYLACVFDVDVGGSGR